MAQEEGKPFGQYLLFERLAMGGMAEIFRAQLVGAAGFTKDVVIKRIHEELSEDDEFVGMFIDEANIAALLTHPNIVQVTDFNIIDKNYFLAMELIEGLDLKRLTTLCRKHRRELPIPLALYIITQALKGLSHAHRFEKNGSPLGIVHRDISPHNILLSNEGEIKVTDFGIARISQRAKKTATGILKGKVSYMAPEQTHTSQVDHRADLFAMAVVLWELLSAQRLFDADNDLLILDKVRHQTILPPHELNPKVSDILSDIVMWGLERDPEDRVPDARTFFRELQSQLPSGAHEEELSELIASLKESPLPTPQPRRGTARLEDTPPPPQGTAQLEDQTPQQPNTPRQTRQLNPTQQPTPTTNPSTTNPLTTNTPQRQTHQRQTPQRQTQPAESWSPPIPTHTPPHETRLESPHTQQIDQPEWMLQTEEFRPPVDSPPMLTSTRFKPSALLPSLTQQPLHHTPSPVYTEHSTAPSQPTSSSLEESLSTVQDFRPSLFTPTPLTQSSPFSDNLRPPTLEHDINETTQMTPQDLSAISIHAQINDDKTITEDHASPGKPSPNTPSTRLQDLFSSRLRLLSFGVFLGMIVVFLWLWLAPKFRSSLKPHEPTTKNLKLVANITSQPHHPMTRE